VSPAELVTVLFTEIVGSTERWQHDRADMAPAVAVHDPMLDSLSEVEDHPSSGWV
jgi:hypothetical protein